jgi:hypothetical protein
MIFIAALVPGPRKRQLSIASIYQPVAQYQLIAARGQISINLT